jgi:hypothetical protein
MKDGQTFGQWLNWNFKTNGFLEIKDKNDHCIYGEDSSGYWFKFEFDSNGVVIYYENSVGAIFDNRTPEIIEQNGRKYQLIPNQIQTKNP